MNSNSFPPLRIQNSGNNVSVQPTYTIILSDNLNLVKKGPTTAFLTVTTGGGGGASTVYAPSGGPYIVYSSSANSGLPNNLVLSAGTNVTIVTDSTAFYVSATTGATAAGGANTQVQFNSSNLLGGDTQLIWDTVNKRFSVGGGALQSGIFTLTQTGGESIFTQRTQNNNDVLYNMMSGDSASGAIAGGWECDAMNMAGSQVIYGIIRTYIVNGNTNAHTGEVRTLVTSSAGTIQGFSVIGASAMPGGNREANVVCGRLIVLNTSNTDGFLYIPSMSGTPSGTPPSYTGKIAIFYNLSDTRIYAYDTNLSGWKKTGVLT